MMKKIAWFATKGTGSNETLRMESLLSQQPGAVEWPFDRADKWGSFKRLWKLAREQRPDLVVMEGTGIAGGLLCLMARISLRIPYVFSSGDAVGPFVRAQHPLVGWGFEIYERLLCWYCAGFIGWTPYLCGRAMAFGAPRAVTAEGWVIGGDTKEPSRATIRAQWGIPESAIVVGIVGNLAWNPRHQWCYGMDLVRAARQLRRTDLFVVVVGSGDGLPHLRREASDLLGGRIVIPGPVSLAHVMPTLCAMDVGSLPQSVDGVGAYRFTTKLPEYFAARLPVITNRIPAAYDLAPDAMWRLPGKFPWTPESTQALVRLLDALSPAMIRKKSESLPASDTGNFSKSVQARRIGAFVEELLNDNVIP